LVIWWKKSPSTVVGSPQWFPVSAIQTISGTAGNQSQTLIYPAHLQRKFFSPVIGIFAKFG